MKLEILNKLTRAVYKTGFVLKKHSPEILLVAGVAGTIAGAVMACKATTKLSVILDEAAGNTDKIRKAAEDENLKQYSVDDAKNDLRIVYVQTGVKILKLYAPAITVGVASIAAILASNDILRKRNAALGAAFAAADGAFEKYRRAVIERFGEQTDKELKYGLKVTEVERTVKEEGGGEKTVKQTVDTIDPSLLVSDYARFFEEGNPEWTADHEYNMVFLRTMEQWANDSLHARGHLFLNDVYERLGFEKTKAGQVVGWVYDTKNPVGDNRVDFGIREVYEPDDFDEWDQTILLDFNVDGNVMDRVKW